MEKIKQQYISLLSSCEDLPFASECLTSLKEEEIMINRDNTDIVQNLLLLYTDRYNIQKNVVRKETVLGYDYLLDKLKGLDKGMILKTTYVFKKDYGYVLVYSEELFSVIGVLKTLNSSLEKMKKLQLIYKKKGLKTNLYLLNTKTDE